MIPTIKNSEKDPYILDHLISYCTMHEVKIKISDKENTAKYHPFLKIILISDKLFQNTRLSIVILAHELGHAFTLTNEDHIIMFSYLKSIMLGCDRDEFDDFIYNTEVKAWDKAFHILKYVGFVDWNDFETIKEWALKTYKRGNDENTMNKI